MNEKEMKQLGNETEAAFRKMLDRAEIPYLPFCENVDKFSPALKNFFESKRPDVMILLRYVGFLIVDVKHKKTSTGHPDFIFNADEIEKYSHFREAFGHEVWYAISNKEIGFKDWHLVPSLQVEKIGVKIKGSKGEPCLAIPPRECIKIHSFDEFLAALFSIEKQK